MEAVKCKINNTKIFPLNGADISADMQAQALFQPDDNKALLDAILKSDTRFQLAQTVQEHSCLLNFDLKLLRRVTYIEDTAEGEEKNYHYTVKITVHRMSGGTSEFEADVKGTQIKRFDWVTSATRSLATIPGNKNEREAFQDKVQTCIEAEDVEEEIIYSTPGWRDVPDIGYRYVYGGGIIGANRPLIHTQDHKYSMKISEDYLGKSELFSKITEMIDLCNDNNTALHLLLYSHIAVLKTLFAKAGYPVNFIMGILGVTNSRKTSLALAMCQIFDRDKLMADAEFATSTPGGLEMTLGLYKDGIAIIDDYKPGTDVIQQREMNNKLDLTVRFCGNGVAKRRMRSTGKKHYPISAACLMTMEHVTGVTSTLSRMFLTEIDAETVQNDRLAYYQTHTWILTTHLADFLSWVTEHFKDVLGYIEAQFQKYRDEYKFAFARYAEMYAALKTGGYLLGRYAICRGFWTDIQAESFLARVEGAVKSELLRMTQRIKNADKPHMVLEALHSILVSQKLVPMRLTAETVTRKEPCYFDDNHIYVQTDCIKKAVNDYFSSNRESTCVVSKEEMINLLIQLSLLEVAISEKTGQKENARKLPIQLGNHGRYLYIRRKYLEELLKA